MAVEGLEPPTNRGTSAIATALTITPYGLSYVLFYAVITYITFFEFYFIASGSVFLVTET